MAYTPWLHGAPGGGGPLAPIDVSRFLNSLGMGGQGGAGGLPPGWVSASPEAGPGSGEGTGPGGSPGEGQPGQAADPGTVAGVTDTPAGLADFAAVLGVVAPAPISTAINIGLGLGQKLGVVPQTVVGRVKDKMIANIKGMFGSEEDEGIGNVGIGATPGETAGTVGATQGQAEPGAIGEEGSAAASSAAATGSTGGTGPGEGGVGADGATGGAGTGEGADGSGNYHHGGRVPKAGPANLLGGEWVINSKSAKRFEPILKAINDWQG